jgi:hypothetical protein
MFQTIHFFFFLSEVIFRSLKEHLFNETHNCKSLVPEKIYNDPTIKSLNFMTCHNIKEKIHRKFITFRLKILGLKIKRNAEMKKKLETFSNSEQ